MFRRIRVRGVHEPRDKTQMGNTSRLGPNRMPIAHRRWVCLIAALGMLAGCADEQAARRAQDDAKIQGVLTAHGELDVGFVPMGGAEDGGATLAAFRHEQRESVLRKQLESVTGRGTDVQQHGTAQLLADAQAFTARHIADEALLEWTRFAGESTSLMAHLAKIDRDTGQLQLFARDDSGLLDKLADQRAAIDRRLKDHTQQIDSLDAQIVDHQSQYESHANTRQSQEAEAAQYAMQIGQAQGVEILQLAEAVRETNKTAADAEVRQKEQRLTIEILESERRVMQRQSALETESLAQVRQQIEVVEQRQDEMALQLEERQAQWVEQFKELRTQFADLTKRFTQVVHDPLVNATTQMTDAIDAAQGAVGHAPRESLQLAKLELTAMHLGKVHVLTQHISAQGSFGRTLLVLASGVEKLVDLGPASYPSEIEPPIYRNQAKMMIDEQAVLISDAQKLIEEARDHAEELAEGSDEDIATTARTYVQLLNTYAGRIEETRLDRPLALAATPTAAAERASDQAASARSLAPSATAAPLDIAITGELPPLPALAVNDQVAVLVWLDGRALTPSAIRQTVQTAAPQNAEQLEAGLGMFDGMYGRFAAAGGTSILAAFPVSEDEVPGPEGMIRDQRGFKPILYVSLAEDADEEAIAAWLSEANPEDQLSTDRHGPWLVVRPPGVDAPIEGTAERRRLFEAAFAASGPSPLAVAVVPNAALRDQAARTTTQLLGADAQQQDVLFKAHWFGMSLKMADELGLYAAVHLEDADSAVAAADLVEAELEKLTQLEGPAALIGAMIRSAVHVDAADELLRVDVSGPSLNAAIGMAVPIVTQMMGEGIHIDMGEVVGEDGFDFSEDEMDVEVEDDLDSDSDDEGFIK